ncbi:hypothetical protein AAE478_003708 [Parahypoxylon ruwenzoriense]
MSLNEFKPPYKPGRTESRPDRSGGISQPWTAARCQRLLRPLLSRIASLRKDAATALQTPVGDATTPETRISATEQQSTNCEWLRPKKRLRLTYSQKRPSRNEGERSIPTRNHKGLNTAKCPSQSEGRTPVPGEIMAATPLLRRARGHVVPSPAVPGIPAEEPENLRTGNKRDPRLKRGSATQRDLDQRLAKLRAQSAPNRYNDLEAIYRSLEALLRATTCDTSQARGPRSFLDMCLRKVPQYIEELEAWERTEAEQNGTVSTLDDFDTSARIYDYLDSIGSNQGWKHLRAVVRADGVNIVRQAISEGLFGDEFSQLLVDLCVQTGALLEAEELFAALVDRQYPRPKMPDSSFAETPCFRVLSMLWTFANKLGRISFLLRRYSKLLSNGNLPQDWLVTQEFKRIWALAARHLSTADTAIDAVTFMCHSVSLLCRRKRTLTGGPEAARLEKDMAGANRQTLTSALSILASMGLLGEMELRSVCISEAEITKIHLIGDRIRCILRWCVAGLELKRPARHGLGNDLLQMALFLSSSHFRSGGINSHLRHCIEQAWRQNVELKSARNNRVRHRLNDMASFVSSVARGCGRGMSLASHNCLDTLFEQLECLELDREILDSMKAMAAFSLAQQTNNVKDFVYAERLASNQSRAAAGDDASSRSLFTGYRWEETIGEWVTVSPVMERRLPQTRIRTRAKRLRSPSRSSVDHSEDDERTATSGTDSVPDPDLEIEQGQQQGPCEPHQPLLTTGTERVNTRKRPQYSGGCHPRAVIGDDALSRRDSKGPASRPEATYPSHDELDSDKENRDTISGRRPRRSVGRIVRNSKPRSSLASQRSSFGDEYSDDELCM